MGRRHSAERDLVVLCHRAIQVTTREESADDTIGDEFNVRRETPLDA
jgi:hypothetical protein